MAKACTGAPYVAPAVTEAATAHGHTQFAALSAAYTKSARSVQTWCDATAERLEHALRRDRLAGTLATTLALPPDIDAAGVTLRFYPQFVAARIRTRHGHTVAQLWAVRSAAAWAAWTVMAKLEAVDQGDTVGAHAAMAAQMKLAVPQAVAFLEDALGSPPGVTRPKSAPRTEKLGSRKRKRRTPAGLPGQASSV